MKSLNFAFRQIRPLMLIGMLSLFATSCGSPFIPERSGDKEDGNIDFSSEDDKNNNSNNGSDSGGINGGPGTGGSSNGGSDNGGSDNGGSDNGGSDDGLVWKADAALQSAALAIISNRCSECHGTGSLGFGDIKDIENVDYLIANKLIVPGSSSKGPFIDSIHKGEMPISGKLPSNEISALENWLISFKKVQSSGDGNDGGSNAGNGDQGSGDNGNGDDGGDDSQAQCAPSDYTTSELRVLNQAEILNSVHDVFEISRQYNLKHQIPVMAPVGEFETLSGIGSITSEHLDGLFVIIETLGERIIADNSIKNRIFQCLNGESTVQCKERLIKYHGKRIFRRPLSPSEISDFKVMKYSASSGLHLDMVFVLQNMFMSPHFLYRVEVDKGMGERSLNPYELATRLSFLIWSSAPDTELLAVADTGALMKPEVLHGQIDRMLQKPMSNAIPDLFGTQWLGIKGVHGLSIEGNLKNAIYQESLLLLRDIFSNDRDVRKLINSDYSFMNASLANHYGISGVSGDQMRKVSYPEPLKRKGILTHASILSLTSNSDETSVQKRGAWVLSRVLCNTPPNPPEFSDEDLEKLEDLGEFATPRDMTEAHSGQKSCAECHSYMDPLGLGLENFDMTGKWRNQWRVGPGVRSGNGEVKNVPIDASGVLPPGDYFETPGQLAQLISEHPLYMRCFSNQLLRYSVGEEIRRKNQCEVEKIANEATSNGASLSSTLKSLVVSPLFQTRARKD